MNEFWTVKIQRLVVTPSRAYHVTDYKYRGLVRRPLDLFIFRLAEHMIAYVNLFIEEESGSTYLFGNVGNIAQLSATVFTAFIAGGCGYVRTKVIARSQINMCIFNIFSAIAAYCICFI